MRVIHRFALLSGLLLGMASRALAQDPTSICTDDPATNTTTCRIDNPIVTQRMTEYDGAFHPEIFEAFGNCNIFGCNRRFGVNLPGISLRRGDLVTVDADGCAQTGGSGSTWKRYVNPQGNNADRLYHGLLGVLNAIEPDGTTMPNPIRIQDVRLQPFWIPVAQPLRLGYEDDNYDDNGYWGHDDGNPEQCNLDGSHGFGGDAFVTVTIQHNAPPPPNASPMPWDIVAADRAVSDPFDLNALLFNPRWGWQTAPVSAPPNFDNCSSPSACTGQVLTKDEPDFGNSIFTCGGTLGFGARGHLNWTVVTYEGRIFWDAHSNPTFGDDDYNFFLNTLVTNGFPSGVTATNPQQIKLEFQARETIDHFDKSPFWHDFHDAVDNNDAEAHIKVDNKDAIVIGLLGLDRVHGSGSESHPVFVLAVHVKSAPLDDTWAIFARNYGNEGWCSDNMHYSNFNNVTLRLPRLISAPATTQATIGAGTQFWASSPSAALGVDVFSAPNQDTFITFHLPSPPADGNDGDRVSGELHLQWSGAAAPIASLTTANAALTTVAPVGDSDSPEGRLADQWAQLTPQQQATYLVMLPPRPPASPDAFQLVPNILSNPPAPASAQPALTAVRDPRQQQHREDIFKSFCGALSGQLPADMGTCASYLPFTQLTHTGTPNAAGWFNTPITVTLTAINVSGKGIDHSEYSFDNHIWVRYTAPFTLPDGIITVYYRSQDVAGTLEATRQQSFRIDRTPPSISCSANPSTLFPPNHKLVPIHVTVNTGDNLSGVAGFKLLAVTSSDPAQTSGSGNTNPDIQDWQIGTPNVSGSLRAERSGSGNGRTYAITYQAQDVAGNAANCRTTVLVPHDRGK